MYNNPFSESNQDPNKIRRFFRDGQNDGLLGLLRLRIGSARPDEPIRLGKMEKMSVQLSAQLSNRLRWPARSIITLKVRECPVHLNLNKTLDLNGQNGTRRIQLECTRADLNVKYLKYTVCTIVE